MFLKPQGKILKWSSLHWHVFLSTMLINMYVTLVEIPELLASDLI